MRNWEQYVRQCLRLEGMTLEREKTIVREVAAQIDDFYREGLSRGMTEQEAAKHARRQVRDWSCFESDILRADPRNARSRIDQWHESAETRTPRTGGLKIMLADVPKDVLYGLRMLRRNPGFTAVAVITLALGIGASTAIFSVVNAALLRPLPYADADQLVTLWSANNDVYVLSGPEYFDFKERQKSFESYAVFETFERGMNLTGQGEPVHAYTHLVQPEFFSLLGVQPLLGRTFTAEEATQGSDHVIVLEHDFWKNQFGGDVSIIGKTVSLDDASYIVLGVMPPGFILPIIENHLWVPRVLDAANPGPRTNGRNLILYGRLKTGVSKEQARDDVRRIARDLATEYPDSYPEKLSGDRADGIRPIREITADDVRPALLILLGSVGLVLLIACANVANLVLARAAGREKEIAVRFALGASRGRIIRQLFTENLLLSLSGGAAGILLAFWSLKTLVEFAPGRIRALGEIGIDLRVLGFAFAVSLLPGLLFGLAPVLQSSKLKLQESLKEGSRASGRPLVRNLLVVTEVALSLVLLIGAGLLIRTFHNYVQLDLGFETESVQTFRIWPPATRYPESSQVTAFYQELLGKFRALPGVESAGAVNFVWLHITGGRRLLMPEGFEKNFPEYDIPYGLFSALIRVATPGYLEAIGIRLQQGRFFKESDTAEAPQVIIVDESFARKAWPNETNIVGKRVAVPNLENGEHSWWTVVGVVGYARDIRMIGREVPQTYFPQAQGGGRVMHVAVKTAGDPESILPLLRREVASIDPNVPIYQVRTLAYYVNYHLTQPRFYALLMGLFAGIALVLGVVGLYGVISYTVSQRTHEIGIRMALGAQSWDILSMVFRQGFLLIAIGSLIGLAGAYGLTRFLESLLYGIAPTDLGLYAGVASLLAAVALLACWIPARRATKVDPMVALRYE